MRVVLFSGGRGSGGLSKELVRDPRIHLTVAINGETGLHRATWVVTDSAQYCEHWPDHTSCFRIGRTDSNRLRVLGKPGDKIESYWYEGEIDLDFEIHIDED